MKPSKCEKCKVQNAFIRTRSLLCCDCFTSYIENNIRREIRIGITEKLKKLNRDYLVKKPPKSTFYVALGFGFSSQVLLKLLTVIPNSGKRPDFKIKSFLNVDTSCLFGRSPNNYYERVNSFIKLNFSQNFDDENNLQLPKLEIIPFCSSIVCSNAFNKEDSRLKLIDIIRDHLLRGTDHIKLLIQLIIFKDIEFYLSNNDSSEIKSLIIASNSSSIASESLQYLTLASGTHIKSIYQHLDFRWQDKHSTIVFTRPLRNLYMKEIMIYWKYCVSKDISSSIGAEISINRSPIEDEIYKFILSQKDKIPNISNIFLKLNENSKDQGYNQDRDNSSLENCILCGLTKKDLHKFCIVCTQLLNLCQLFNQKN